MDVNKECCKTCTFWLSCTENDEDGFGHKETHGLCGRAVMEDHSLDTIDEPMVTMDGSQYMANLYTKFDHYCKEWKKINA